MKEIEKNWGNRVYQHFRPFLGRGPDSDETVHFGQHEISTT